MRVQSSAASLHLSSKPITSSQNNVNRPYINSYVADKRACWRVYADKKPPTTPKQTPPKKSRKPPAAEQLSPEEIAAFQLDGPAYAFKDEDVDYMSFEPDPEGHKAGR